jgi:hypothetical protein
MKQIFSVLLLSVVLSVGLNAQETSKSDSTAEEVSGHMFSHHKIHHSGSSWQAIVKFLGVNSLFFTAILPIHKNAVIKPEVLAGNVNETTVWYSYNIALVKSIGIGMFFGPGLSYSFDSGQGARVRWQYGFGTPNLTDDIPLSFFLLSNITHDFNTELTTWDWYNFGLSYQLNKRVRIMADYEGYFTSNPYVFTNIGFVLDI